MNRKLYDTILYALRNNDDWIGEEITVRRPITDLHGTRYYSARAGMQLFFESGSARDFVQTETLYLGDEKIPTWFFTRWNLRSECQAAVATRIQKKMNGDAPVKVKQATVV